MKDINYNDISLEDSNVSMKNMNKEEEEFVEIPLGIEMKEADEDTSRVENKGEKGHVKGLSQNQKSSRTDNSSSPNKKYGKGARFIIFYISLVLLFSLIPALILYIIQAPIVFLLRKILIKEGCHAIFPEGTYENLRTKLLHILKTPYRWLMIAYNGEGELWEPFP